MNMDGAYFLLVDERQVNDAEPLAQGLVRVLEERAGGDREAMTPVRRAGIALPFEGHGGDRIDHDGAAAWTMHCIGPTMLGQISLAGFLARERLLPLREGHLVNAFAGLGYDGYLSALNRIIDAMPTR